ncbi:hypothetical protein ACPWT1_14945 [Ramlibacter sp. MMS24-I3-19]|uniref:hypothetical protein n=1 Tax=Ramlibacter sp. MMS24-I3-19 TaxID=3416606 RepID=UPI003CFC6278
MTDRLAPSLDLDVSAGGFRIAGANSVPAGAGNGHTAAALGALLQGVPGRSANKVHAWLDASAFYQAVVALDTSVLTDAEILERLDEYWADIFGDTLGPLAVTYAIQRGGASVVTGCCRESLAVALAEAAAANGLALSRIGARSSRVWRQCRRAVGRHASGCFAVVDEDAISLGAWQDGRWVAWSNEGFAAQDWSGLRTCVQRFARLHALDDAVPVWTEVAGGRMREPAPAGFEHWTLLNATGQPAEVLA